MIPATFMSVPWRKATSRTNLPLANIWWIIRHDDRDTKIRKRTEALLAMKSSQEIPAELYWSLVEKRVSAVDSSYSVRIHVWVCAFKRKHSLRMHADAQHPIVPWQKSNENGI
jgi:hypothetical protein